MANIERASPLTAADLTRRLKEEAIRLGFDRVGIAPATSPPGYGRFLNWLDQGHAAGMEYLERHAKVRSHPDRLLDGVRSVVMLSVVYGRPSSRPTRPTQGQIARYARGRDYHRVLWDKLETLLNWLRGVCPEVSGRAVVDTAPLLERDFARLAGLGWIGKNTMLIDRGLGSFTFLGALLVDLELVADEPHGSSHCGTCTRCLEACPTGALVEPSVLDARRCISYWTIEHKGAINEEFAGQLHGWVFGCDICQDVCPWNRKSPPGRMPELDGRAEWTNPDLMEWLELDPLEWNALLKGTALARAKRKGLVRNAVLVLGERRSADAVPALGRRLADAGEDQGVRIATAWALGRIGTESAKAILQGRRDDPDLDVREAVERALMSLREHEEVTGQAH